MNKMIAQQTAKKEKLLDNFLKNMKRNIRFRKMWNSFVTLTIWEMESPVISWIFTVPEKIMKVLSPIFTGNTGKEFVLSIYKSGKTKKLSETCHRRFWSQLWRYFSKLQQTVCKKSDKKPV